MLRRFSLVVVAAAALTSPATAQLRLHGSNTVGEQLAPALVRAWLAEQGFDRIETVDDAPLERTITGTGADGATRWVEIHAHGSSTSFRDLDAGVADIGMSSRRIRDSEIARLQPLGRLDQPKNEFVVGIDGLAVIVHPDNPIPALTIEQIRDAFSGRITNWSQLGGTNQPITRYARDEN